MIIIRFYLKIMSRGAAGKSTRLSTQSLASVRASISPKAQILSFSIQPIGFTAASSYLRWYYTRKYKKKREKKQHAAERKRERSRDGDREIDGQRAKKGKREKGKGRKMERERKREYAETAKRTRVRGRWNDREQRNERYTQGEWDITRTF